MGLRSKHPLRVPLVRDSDPQRDTAARICGQDLFGSARGSDIDARVPPGSETRLRSLHASLPVAAEGSLPYVRGLIEL